MNHSELQQEGMRLCAALRKAPSETQWMIAEKICGESRHVRIRGFMIIESNRSPIETVAFHVAGGIWKAYNLPFDAFVDLMNKHPEKDEELTMSIYGV